MTGEPRAHERSPWRIAYEQLAALMFARGGASESVTLRMNAKGGTQPELTCVVRDGETLSEAVGRAETAYDALLAKYARPDTPFGPGRTQAEVEAGESDLLV